MSGDKMLSDIKDRLRLKNVHELWEIAKLVGVSSPSVLKKNELIEVTIAIISGQRPPDPQTQRGAPRKESAYDSQLVADIEECMRYFSALKEGTGVVSADVLTVSDRSERTPCSGILAQGEKYLFIRVGGILSSPDDVFVAQSFISRFALKEGDYIEGECYRRSEDEAPGLLAITKINGSIPDALKRSDFELLTPVYPEKRIKIVASPNDLGARMTNLFAPVGFGQRAVITGGTNTGKSTLLKSIATGICLNQPHIKTLLLLISERPEEITFAKRSATGAELYYTTFDMPKEAHAHAIRLATEYCKRQVEGGADVVLLVDGFAQLEEEEQKRLLASAKNSEEGGSLTVICTAEEGVVGAANLCVALSERLAAEGTYPAIDITRTYTRRGELLQSYRERAAAENIKNSLSKGNTSRSIVQLFAESGDDEIIAQWYRNG